MRRAWKRVKANKGAPGVDGMRIEDFPAFARSNLPAIRQALRDGSYRSQPVRRVTIPKPSGGERVMASVMRFLTGTLKLVVNEQKSRVVKTNDCTFLGFTFRGTKLRWSERAYHDFRHRLRKLTGRSWGVSIDCRLRMLADYVRGWMGYFGISDYYRPIPELDHWLRRRVRMCYWKQWRGVRNRIRQLLGLGTSKRTAIWTGMSSKSYWHLSRSLGTQTGMTNDWLKSQGLISIRDQWMKAHGYA